MGPGQAKEWVPAKAKEWVPAKAKEWVPAKAKEWVPVRAPAENSKPRLSRVRGVGTAGLQTEAAARLG